MKRIHRDDAVMPKHVKFSELLQMGRNQNNPLLSTNNDARSGYEVDIECSHYLPFLVLSISNIFELLDLDIRTIDAQILRRSRHFEASFFVQPRPNGNGHGHGHGDQQPIDGDLRHRIECLIAELFQKQNVAATIKTKMIEMGTASAMTMGTDIAIRSGTGSGTGTGTGIQMEMASLSATTTTVQTRPHHKLPPLHVDVLGDDDLKNGDVVIEVDDDRVPPHRQRSSPASLSNTAQITESVVIITPKAQLALPPSIEKQELTLNVIGLTETGQIAVSRQSTIELIAEEMDSGGTAQIDGVDDRSKESSGSAHCGGWR